MKKLAPILLLLLTVETMLLAQSTISTEQAVQSEQYINRYGSLSNTLYRIKVEKQATVTFLGGSITNMEGWRNLVCDYLTKAYPGTKFDFRNAGIPSLGSFPHAFRLEKDVISKGRTDLLFVESAVNDHVNGTLEKTQRRALEGIVRHILTNNPNANIVLMAFVDEDKIADYRSGKVPVEVQVHQDIARMYGLPFINLAKEVTDRTAAGEFTWKDDFRDLHPSPFGHSIYLNTIKQLLQVEMGKPVPKRLTPAQLPSAADGFHYATANYADIHRAEGLGLFRVQESWQPADSIPTRPGFVQVPVLEATQGGASLELPFTGRIVGMAVISGPDAGNIRYSIDGTDYPPIDLYTEWSGGLHLPWYVLLGDELPAGKHTLRLQTSQEKNQQSTGNACRIVYFLVNR